MAGLRDLRAEVRRHLPPIAMGLVIGVAVGVLVMFGVHAMGGR